MDNNVTIDFITEYLHSLLPAQTGLLGELSVYAKENYVPIIHPEVAQFLKVMGLTIKPKRILEIGTAIGYSAIILSQTLQDGGSLLTIERDINIAKMAIDNIKKANLEDKIKVCIGDAIQILSTLDEPFDLIFLDAAKGQYPNFLPDCIRLLNPGGMLISDNVLFKGIVANDDLVPKNKRTIARKLREYLEIISNNDQLDTTIIPMGDGIAISLKKEGE